MANWGPNARQSQMVEDRRFDKNKPTPQNRWGGGNPPGAPAPENYPGWMNGIAPRMSGQGNYETGDPEIDTFLRNRNMRQWNKNSPYAGAYNDPERAAEMLRNFYNSGRYRDRAAMEQLQRNGDDPFARLLRRAYQDGWRSGGQPQAERRRGRGLGFAEGGDAAS